MLPVLALAFAAITSASGWSLVTIAPIARVDVGLFSAYNAEYNTQILQLTGYKVNYTIGGRVYTTGRIGNKRVVITMSGIGMTNAGKATGGNSCEPLQLTMTAQAMALLFQPKYMILSGIAGGIDPDLRIGDVVIPRTWFNPQLQKFIRPLHDENDNLTNYFADSGLDFPDKFYTEPGKTPGDFAMTLPSPATCQLPAPSAALLANVTANPALTVSSGFAVPIEVELLVNKSVSEPCTALTHFTAVFGGAGMHSPMELLDTFKTPTPPTAFHLPVSSTILATAARVLRNITLENNAGYASLPYIPTARITQRGMSSNTFLDNPDYRQNIFNLLRPSCVEMEGHAVIQVCISNKVQCAVVRSISDLAGGAPGQPGENEIGAFFGVAAVNTAKVAIAIIRALPL
ncbi:hypothetical protein QJQ45_021394 [Haematococcus lacustris]|nr:hypothetical protein QJQ45_021394 [Haematococcus lacustris]